MTKRTQHGDNSLSLFSVEETTGLTAVQAQFLGSRSVSIADLFRGYDSLRALTYSASLPLIRRLLPWFADVEIIFGLEDVLSPGIQDVLAFQQAAVLGLRDVLQDSPPEIRQRVEAGTLRFWVMRNKVSHKKTFLLSGGGRDPRVIVGSANLSQPGFGGVQAENLIVFDDPDAYAYYAHDLTALQAYADDVPPETLQGARAVTPENLPIMTPVVRTRQLVILESGEPASPEHESRATFAVRFQEAQARYRDLPLAPDQQGRTTLIPETVQEALRTFTARQTVKETASVNQCLRVSIPDHRVTLNGASWDLQPPAEAVRQDAERLQQYMQGFDRFLGGDTAQMQRRYFALLNWLFLAPVLPALRAVAIQTDRKGFLYPAVAVVYGKSNAGKTDFIRLVSRMMFGIAPLIPANEFTSTRYKAWAAQAHLFPMLVDDMDQDRFRNHAVGLIKGSDHWDQPDQPVIVLSANKDLGALDSEITKRIITIHVEASIPKEVAIHDVWTQRLQRHMTTAFYRAYLGQCLPAIGDILGQLRQDVQGIPDPFLVSSQILAQLFARTLGTCPAWGKPLTLHDYIQFGTVAIQHKLWQMYETNPQMFEVDRKRNRLILHTADRGEIAKLRKEIPDYCLQHQAGEQLVLYLRETETFLQRTFPRKPWWRRPR
ncbi:MAG: phospholipase D family protein [Sulfobacillus sp.]|nr:phospholipase D family protein [Sulfobacillus sp.]